MFIIDATFEDCRIQAKALDDGRVGTNWNVTISDNFSGKSYIKELTPVQLAMVLAINLDSNGTPDGYEKMYEVLGPIFADVPNELRPIP